MDFKIDISTSKVNQKFRTIIIVLSENWVESVISLGEESLLPPGTLQRLYFYGGKNASAPIHRHL